MMPQQPFAAGAGMMHSIPIKGAASPVQAPSSPMMPGTPILAGGSAMPSKPMAQPSQRRELTLRQSAPPPQAPALRGSGASPIPAAPTAALGSGSRLGLPSRGGPMGKPLTLVGKNLGQAAPAAPPAPSAPQQPSPDDVALSFARQCPGPVEMSDGHIIEPQDFIKLQDLCELVPFLTEAELAVKAKEKEVCKTLAPGQPVPLACKTESGMQNFAAQGPFGGPGGGAVASFESLNRWLRCCRLVRSYTPMGP